MKPDNPSNLPIQKSKKKMTKKQPEQPKYNFEPSIYGLENSNSSNLQPDRTLFIYFEF